MPQDVLKESIYHSLLALEENPGKEFAFVNTEFSLRRAYKTLEVIQQGGVLERVPLDDFTRISDVICEVHKVLQRAS